MRSRLSTNGPIQTTHHDGFIIIFPLLTPTKYTTQAAKAMADSIRKKAQQSKGLGTARKSRAGLYEEAKLRPKLDKRGGARSVSPTRAWDLEKSALVSPHKMVSRVALTAGGDVDLVRQRLGRTLPFATS